MIIMLATNILPHGIIKYLKILNKYLMPSTCNYMGNICVTMVIA
jgi:hypothetical protein